MLKLKTEHNLSSTLKVNIYIGLSIEMFKPILYMFKLVIKYFNSLSLVVWGTN